MCTNMSIASSCSGRISRSQSLRIVRKLYRILTTTFLRGIDVEFSKVTPLGLFTTSRTWTMEASLGPLNCFSECGKFSRQKALGWGFNSILRKCEWSWLNAECSSPCPLSQVALVPTSEVQMLGVPLGSDAFVCKLVEGKLLATSTKVMAKLADFDDPQAAMYLLRLSYGIVRANHFMRTTPLPQWEQWLSSLTRVSERPWRRSWE